MAKDCLFCRIINKEIASKIVHEDERAVAFEDINPQAPTHIVIIPRKHVASLNDASGDDAELIGYLHLVAAKIARGRGLAEAGYRLVINNGRSAGQSIFHLHLHLLGGRGMGWPPG